MSKTDAIRAMKQARAAAAAAAAPARPAAARPAAPRPTSAAAPAAPTASAADPGPLADLAPEALCGHANMGGKRCTRPQGHAEKNHRYAA